MLILTYGTLLKGESNHGLLQDSLFVKEGITKPEYTMISLGGFPGILTGGTTSIKGEVYEVDKKTLDRLDRLEGHPDWYKRTPIELLDGTQVEVYIYPPLKGEGEKRVIESGSWRDR